jgi:cytochrome c-type biogenesis protein CcmH/NrfF
VLLWSLPGAGLIILVWAYLRFSGRAVHTKEHEERLKATEAEVQRLGEYRNRPPRA